MVDLCPLTKLTDLYELADDDVIQRLENMATTAVTCHEVKNVSI